MSKIVIAGGTGYLGQLLVRHLGSEVSEIVILTRNKVKAHDDVKLVQWDAQNLGEWVEHIEDSDALINLTGKSVDCRYTKKNKALIYNSRIKSTRALGQAIERCQNPPRVWINASSATIYNHSLNRQMTETEGEIGSGFSVEVCKSWEHELNSFDLPNTRKIIARIGIVLGAKGGAFLPLKRLAQFGLGGKMESGNQHISWIHSSDFIRIMDYFLKSDVQGVYNVTGPRPTRNARFMSALRKALNVPFGLPNPAWLLGAGALLIRTETELILKSRNVIPEKLINEGHQFEFEDIQDALKDLLKN